jgi:hypothetical protein
MPETSTTRRGTATVDSGTVRSPRRRVISGEIGRAESANGIEPGRPRPAAPSTPPATRGPVKLDDVPYWMPYLLWFDADTSSWVLDYNGGDGRLLFDAENRTLTRPDEGAAAQAWAAQVCREPATPDGDRPLAVAAWRHVTVPGRTGWVPLFDPGHAGDRTFHDLHESTGAVAGCCAWPPAVVISAEVTA